MTRLDIVPTKSVDAISFGANQAGVEATFGQPDRIFKKTKWSKGKTADYGNFHIHYDANDQFDAIEIFEAEIRLPSCVTPIPANKEAVLRAMPSLEADKYGLTSVSESIGASVEDDLVTSILFGKSGYYA